MLFIISKRWFVKMKLFFRQMVYRVSQKNAQNICCRKKNNHILNYLAKKQPKDHKLVRSGVANNQLLQLYFIIWKLLSVMPQHYFNVLPRICLIFLWWICNFTKHRCFRYFSNVLVNFSVLLVFDQIHVFSCYRKLFKITYNPPFKYRLQAKLQCRHC